MFAKNLSFAKQSVDQIINCIDIDKSKLTISDKIYDAKNFELLKDVGINKNQIEGITHCWFEGVNPWQQRYIKLSEFDIMYSKGISKMGEIIDLGVNHGIIDKSGSWFSYGETKLGQGRDAVKAILVDNPDLCEELESKIVEALQS